MCLKRKVFNQCITPTLTYGRQTWTLTKELVHKIEICQKKMERKILGIKQIDKIPNKTIREKTEISDILEIITKTKWEWAGHVACMKDNRWTVRCFTELQVRNGKRTRGRPRRTWCDHQQWQGTTWSSPAKDSQQWRNLTDGYFQQWRDIP